MKGKIIRNLNVYKAHRYDDISIRMLKICDSEVVEPQLLTYKNCIDSGIFPDIWKRSYIIPTYKNMINVLLTFPSCFFITNLWPNNWTYYIQSCISYLEDNEFLIPHQSGFRPNDAWIHKLISIVHNIYARFDHKQSLEFRGNFWTSQKRLIKYSTKDCYKNLTLLVYQETF